MEKAELAYGALLLDRATMVYFELRKTHRESYAEHLSISMQQFMKRRDKESMTKLDSEYDTYKRLLDQHRGEQ